MFWICYKKKSYESRSHPVPSRPDPERIRPEWDMFWKWLISSHPVPQLNYGTR